jgi:glyoxylase-like metal-dependent hydrolase (beta-lactamase superfamily II)
VPGNVLRHADVDGQQGAGRTDAGSIAQLRKPGDLARGFTGAKHGLAMEAARMTTTPTSRVLHYDVFVNDPPPQDGVLPNGEPKRFSPMASTLISGSEDAVLTDPGMTTTQAAALGDWVAAKDRNVTAIFVTHGHGDHWFASGLLAERFGARVVATPGTIAHMEAGLPLRPILWDKVYPGAIPPSPVTAVAVPGDRIELEATSSRWSTSATPTPTPPASCTSRTSTSSSPATSSTTACTCTWASG